MNILMRCYDRLRAKEPLSTNDCEALVGLDLHTFQLASLACMLLYKPRIEPCEATLFGWIVSRHPPIKALVTTIFAGHELLQTSGSAAQPLAGGDERLVPILRHTKLRSPIGQANLKRLIDSFVHKTVSLDFMAVWLVTVLSEGLSAQDLHHLISAMLASGDIFDLRDTPELHGRRLIRRYPTGALSEKVALIQPALISALAQDHPIATPFFVARSLGFTGGTWDKLSVLPGFSFPPIGPDMLAVLQRCHAAYAVARDTCAPADRMMYELRHLTGTIESLDLLVSSIASKQLAIPAHRVLLDIRYGPGAFVCSQTEAHTFQDLLVNAITSGGVPCNAMLTPTPQPSGNAVGNSLEVAEALAIMRSDVDDPLWDRRAFVEQQELVVQFSVELLRREFPGTSADYWRAECERSFATGKVLSAFQTILIAHGVSPDDANHIVNDPHHLFASSARADVSANANGVIASIDQRALGYVVNFRLNNQGSGTGVVLRKRLGDRVQAGDTLATLFTPKSMAASEAAELSEVVLGCFSL